MPFIDERGRVLGRLNIVDAAVALMLLALLPAGYGAYLLFRDPPPKLTAVLPSRLREGPNLQVEVRGENFRPYMRVSFSTFQGRTFLFNSSTSAVVQLPDLPVGKYDVVLFDYMQEVARLPEGFTLEPQPSPPAVTLDVVGVLTSLTPAQAAKIQAGHHFPEAGSYAAEVVSVGPPEPEVLHIKTGEKATITVPVDGPVQLPVRLRTKCFVETTTDGALRCTVAGVPLAPDANVPYPGLGTTLNLRISEVHYPGRSRTAVVHVRFVMSPEVRAKLKPADQDIGARAHPAGMMATLVSLADRGDASATMFRDDRVRQAIPTTRLVAVDAVLRVPVEETPLGWTYKGAPVKVGAAMSFETAAYTIDGGVIDVTVGDAEPAAQGDPQAPPK